MLTESLKEEARQIHRQLVCGLPVDLREVCDCLGVDYHEEPMPERIDGMFVQTEDGGKHIFVNNIRSKMKGRRRFSCAHEIGHAIIAIRGFDEGAENRQLGVRDPVVERACNVFAAELLMPDGVLKEMWNQFRREIDVLEQLAKWFGVTTSALSIRLKELGII
jgi:Zn-dependent peptidase ImmA (M78 family)